MGHRSEVKGGPVDDREVREITKMEKSSPEIDVELQAHIGRHLKAAYDDILSQDVPDRFLDLLKSLEEKEKPNESPKGAR